jgi:hypothetical protein
MHAACCGGDRQASARHCSTAARSLTGLRRLRRWAIQSAQASRSTPIGGVSRSNGAPVRAPLGGDTGGVLCSLVCSMVCSLHLASGTKLDLVSEAKLVLVFPANLVSGAKLASWAMVSACSADASGGTVRWYSLHPVNPFFRFVSQPFWASDEVSFDTRAGSLTSATFPSAGSAGQTVLVSLPRNENSANSTRRSGSVRRASVSASMGAMSSELIPAPPARATHARACPTHSAGTARSVRPARAGRTRTAGGRSGRC